MTAGGFIFFHPGRLILFKIQAAKKQYENDKKILNGGKNDITKRKRNASSHRRSCEYSPR